MKVELENVKPMDIEKRSFEIITEELGDTPLIPGTELVVKRCIHTSADFDYAKNLCFSENAVEKAIQAIKDGACIVTDTQMAKAGINKRALARYGGEVYCFMSDEDVAKIAKENGSTRATASMDKAAGLDKKLIFAIGNAPTALVRLYELIEEKKLDPELIIGVPVGFVQNHCHNISTTSGGTDIKYHSSSHCRKDHCKTKLQEHVMCKWRTKGINSFTGTYIERQGKRGIDSPAHGADSKEEKSKYNKCCIDDPHKCTYIPLRK